MMERLLSPAEAAELLGVTPGTLAVWRSVRRYSLPFVKVGAKVRYSESDVAKFVESRRVKVEVPA